MKHTTVLLQNGLKSIMDSFGIMQRECKDISDAYFKSGASATVSALASDTTPATVATKFTKANYTAGITLADNLNKFFQNQAVTTADYLATLDALKYGNATLATQLSVAVEEIGKRIYAMVQDCLSLVTQGRNLVEMYFDNEIGDIVSAFDADRIIPGSEMTRTDLSLAVTMLQEWEKFFTNTAVTQADYSSTVSRWLRLSLI